MLAASALGGVVALGGCAGQSSSTKPLSHLSESATTPLILNEGSLLDLPAVDRATFDSEADPLFRLLVAEFAGQRGLMEIAVENYVATAKQSQDLDIAKRATRIAVFARNDRGALEAAQIWAAKAPQDSEAHQILAAMYIRAGDAEAAIRELEIVLDGKSDVANRQLRMIANLLSREEDKLTALEVMEKLLVNRERDPDALVAYALLAIRAEDMARSDAAMNRIIEAGDADTNIAMAYIALLQKFDKSRVALKWLEGAIEKRPGETGLRLIYARLLADSNRYEEARVQFALVAEQTPDNSDVIYALGLLNLQGNRIEAAAVNFTRLLDLKVRADDANYYLAQIAESRENFDRALGHYRAIDAGTNYFQAQVRIALLLSSMDRVADAQVQLNSLVPEDEAQRLQIVRAEGEILTRHKRYEDAMAIYDRVLADTYDMELLYTRAMLAEKIGRLDVLESDLKTIIEREPGNAQALNALGYTLADHTDRYEEAYGYVERAYAIDPEDFYILDSMGWVLY
ncbi:MAG: tetratricopeptide repeat protein, partial [Gammaproteobacteria bacterium]